MVNIWQQMGFFTWCPDKIKCNALHFFLLIIKIEEKKRKLSEGLSKLFLYKMSFKQCKRPSPIAVQVKGKNFHWKWSRSMLHLAYAAASRLPAISEQKFLKQTLVFLYFTEVMCHCKIYDSTSNLISFNNSERIYHYSVTRNKIYPSLFNLIP